MDTKYLEIQNIETRQIYAWLGEISDPEIPVLSILDLGIVRHVDILETDTEGRPKKVRIDITPTYSGCPAMDIISMQIRMKLLSEGVESVEIQQILHPSWSSDWISQEGLSKMKEYGIAPPHRKSQSDKLGLFEEDNVPCPRCNSIDTQLISKFGSTSCKAMYRCNSCLEPFEHFKCH